MYPYQQGFNNQQQQQQPLQSQQTGYGAFNPQQTGFVPPQQTGYNFQQQPQQFQQPQQTGIYGVPNGNLQQLNPAQTGFYPQQQQQQPLSFQPTGLPPASFGSNPPAQQHANEVENTELRIPPIRISFITLEDQKKFEHLFRISVPRGENAIDGPTARDILMKSNIPAAQLAEIWSLSDTTKSGKLLFPEFALALHLCNVVLKGESLPFELPQSMKTEITNFVDNISFYIPEEESSSRNTQPQSTALPSTQAPAAQNGFNTLQQQPTGFAPLQQQPTGFNAGALQPQRTGFAPLQPQATSFAPLQPQATGFAPLQQQPTGFNAGPLQPQRTGLAPLQPQATGFAPLQQQATGFAPLQQQATGFAPLQQQPTAGITSPQTNFNATALNPQRTGGALTAQQTGFTSVLTNQTGILPQQTGAGFLPPQGTGFSALPPMPTGPLLPQKTGGLTNFFNTVSEAPVAKSTEWAITPQERATFEKIFKNISQQGYISGQQAIQVLSKSGLGRPDLEKIWNLSDINNRGKLNKDEFAVAMHLIYRRLSGMEIPNYLPQELVPPSTKVLDDVKLSLKTQDRFGKKPSKISSSVSNNFKNDDDDSGIYVSRNRRKTNGGGVEKTEETSDNSDLTVSQLKKNIQEKKIILSAIDARDEDRSTDAYSQQKQANEIETLKIKIKDAHTKLVNSGSSSSVGEKQELLKRLRAATDKLPVLMSQLVSIDNQIRDAKIELLKAKLQKESPSIQFFGSAEERARAKSRYLIKQRMASLTGEPAPSAEGFEDGEAKLEAEKEKINKETESQLNIMREIESSIKNIADGVSAHLETSNTEQVGHEKFETGNGISSDEVKSFIDMLKAIKPPQIPQQQQQRYASAPVSQNASANQISSRVSSTSSINSSQSTGVDRAAYIKQQAQERMNARLAKLGIKRGQPTSSQPEPAKAAVESVPQNVPSPVSEVRPPPATAPPPPAKRNSSSSTTQPPTAAAPPITNNHNEDDEDDEDEELSRLLAEKAKLEEQEKEKQRKRAERKAEIARLKAEMESMKKKEAESEEEEEEEKEEKEDDAITKENTNGTANGKKEIPAATTNSEPPAREEPIQNPATHATNNPFFKPGTTVPITETPTPVVQKGNPFFKHDVSRTSSSASQVPAFDKDAAEAQRRAQRGQSNVDDDDDWGDEAPSDEEEEDAIPLRGPAHLASLLFGGGSVPSRAPSVPETPAAAPIAAPVAPATAPPAAEAVNTPPPPPPAAVESVPVTTNNSDQDDDFETPPSTSGTTPVQEDRGGSPSPPPIPNISAPTIDADAPTISNGSAPPLPDASAPSAPPLPDSSAPSAPPLPDSSAPIAPPLPNGFAPPAPPIPTTDAPPAAPPLPPTGEAFGTAAPPPPPLPPTGEAFGAAPPAPPPPPPPAAAPTTVPQVGGGISALLGEIQGGKSLRKVADTEKHHVNGATVGKVI